MRALSTFSLLFCFLFLFLHNAHTQCYSVRDAPRWQLRTGVGLLSTFKKDAADNAVPPLSLELRYRPSPNISIGLLAGGSVNNATIDHHSGASMNVRNHFRILALRTAVHTQRWERWAPYGGISLSYQCNRVIAKDIQGEATDYLAYTPRKTGLFYGAFVGTCYQPVPQLEIFGELGYGLSIITMGVGFSW